jgi:hypothetical protein
MTSQLTNRLKLAIVLVVALAASGCAVRYGPRIAGIQPGYEDERLGETTYQVRIGEAWAKDWADLEKFAIYRAADIAEQAGYKHFAVVSATTQINQYQIQSPSTSNTVGTISGTGRNAYVNLTTTTQQGTTSNISGGWYYLVFKLVPTSEMSQYERVVDVAIVKSDLKYFIEKRR